MSRLFFEPPAGRNSIGAGAGGIIEINIMVETGFTRAKNAINIMMKNLMDFSAGTIAFWALGFGLMFGANPTGWFGTSGFFLSDFTHGGDPWVLAFLMFQVVFAATAATIVSGAMAERTKFVGYLVYSVDISEHGGLAYPDFELISHGGGISGMPPPAGGVSSEPVGRTKMSPVSQT